MIRNKTLYLTVTVMLLVSPATAQQPAPEGPNGLMMFDDRKLLDRGAQQYAKYSKEILMAMIDDDALPNDYQRAASLRVFRENYADEVVSKEKKNIEKILLRRLKRTDSPFVQVEIMHTLCLLDRIKYLKSMVPALIQKLDHYNPTVNDMAYKALEDIVEKGDNRAREARIFFNTLRKVLFLSRKRLTQVVEPDMRLAQKLKLLRWSIKVLGNQELDNLPNEVLGLL
ncbi:MAG: hypothetical protein KC900_10965 [Candidatus Omnitrophica bacterium]|nr:hypothetical protein [Candidatus Omnitrophota bacterium]